ASKPWPSRAAAAARRGCGRTPRVSSPSSSKSAASSGLVRTLEGQPDLAIVCRDLAAPEPGRTDGRTLFALGKAHFVTHRFDDALAQLLLAIQDNPGAPGAYGFLAECYAHMGPLDGACAIVARLRAITPQIRPRHPP